MPELTQEQIDAMLAKAREEAIAAELPARVKAESDKHLQGLRKAEEAAAAKKVAEAVLEARAAERKEILAKLGVDGGEGDDEGKKLTRYQALQAELELQKSRTAEIEQRVAESDAKRTQAEREAGFIRAGVQEDRLPAVLKLYGLELALNAELTIESFLEANPWLTTAPVVEKKLLPYELKTSKGKGGVPNPVVDVDKAVEAGRRTGTYGG